MTAMKGDRNDIGVVRDFKRRAQAALPGRVVEVVLFGSRARGEAQLDSDWDVAVFLEGEPSSQDRRTLSDAAYDILLETDHYIQHVPLPAARKEARTLLLDHIRRDGRAV